MRSTAVCLTFGWVGFPEASCFLFEVSTFSFVLDGSTGETLVETGPSGTRMGAGAGAEDFAVLVPGLSESKVGSTRPEPDFGVGDASTDVAFGLNGVGVFKELVRYGFACNEKRADAPQAILALRAGARGPQLQPQRRLREQ